MLKAKTLLLADNLGLSLMVVQNSKVFFSGWLLWTMEHAAILLPRETVGSHLRRLLPYILGWSQLGASSTKNLNISFLVGGSASITDIGHFGPRLCCESVLSASICEKSGPKPGCLSLPLGHSEDQGGYRSQRTI